MVFLNLITQSLVGLLASGFIVLFLNACGGNEQFDLANDPSFRNTSPSDGLPKDPLFPDPAVGTGLSSPPQGSSAGRAGSSTESKARSTTTTTPTTNPEQMEMRSKLERQIGELNKQVDALKASISFDEAEILARELTYTIKEFLSAADAKKLQKNADLLENASKKADFPKNKNDWSLYQSHLGPPLKYQIIFDEVILKWWPGPLGDFTDERFSYATIIEKSRAQAKNIERLLAFAKQKDRVKVADLKPQLLKIVENGELSQRIEKRIQEIKQTLKQETILSFQVSDLIKPVS